MAMGIVERSKPRAAERRVQKNESCVIVARESSSVKLAHEEQEHDPPVDGVPKRRSGRKKTRRQSHGSAWHWNQTDTWYYTLPGSKKRVPLFDEDGNRIRGVDNKKTAQLALARVKLGQGWQPEAP